MSTRIAAWPVTRTSAAVMRFLVGVAWRQRLTVRLNIRTACYVGMMPFLFFADTFARSQDAPASIKIQRDVVYASKDGVDLLCDVYIPANAAGESVGSPSANPVVLILHGGAWSSGSKLTMSNYAFKVANEGMVAIAIDYRHAPLHKFPAQVDDVRDALVWTNENAAKYRIDADRIGIFGYSAGGHLACMIATVQDEPMPQMLSTSCWTEDDPRWKMLPKVKSVVAGGPPCDFRELPPENNTLAFFLGGTRAERPEVYKAASPVSFASQGDCPIGFVHGERDFIVSIESSRALYNAQVDAGVDSEFVVVEKQGHMITFLHPTTSAFLLDFTKRRLINRGDLAGE